MPRSHSRGRRSGGHPVIALLDSGVAAHNWLPGADGGSPFVIDAGASTAGPARIRKTSRTGWRYDLPDYGSHWSHATFIAGLICQAAPSAQILSLRVMDKQGKGRRQSEVVNALTWLADNAHHVPVDIVLMAFGAPGTPP